MNILDIVRCAFKEIARNKARSGACAAGYAVGAMAVVATMGMLHHFEKTSVDVLKSVGTHFGAYLPVPEAEQNVFKNGGPSVEGVYTYLFDADFVAEIKRLPGVRDAAPYFVFSRVFNKVPVIIGGLAPDNIATWNNVCAPAQMKEGRFLTASDTDGVMLEEAYAKVVGRKTDDTFEFWGRKFRVVGIVNSGIRAGKANIYAPLPTVQALVHRDTSCVCINRAGCLSKPNDINIVLVEVADARNQKAVLNLVQKTIGSATISSYNCYQPASGVIGQIGKMMLVISVVAAFFLVIFAASIQMQSLAARSRDIGLLKAIGWSNINVAALIFFESFFLALAGVSAGCAGGVLFFWLYFKNAGLLSPAMLFLVFILMICGGMIAGAAVALKALKLKPAELWRRA